MRNKHRIIDTTARNGFLHNLTEIAAYMGINRSTLRRWYSSIGVPLCKGPSGDWFTTKGALDQWALALSHEQRATLLKICPECKNEATFFTKGRCMACDDFDRNAARYPHSYKNKTKFQGKENAITEDHTNK